MREMFEWVLFKIGVKLLMRSSKYMDIFAPGDNVEAITFARDKKYIDRVQEI